MGALVLGVGLLTVDVVHVVDRVPGPDEKVVGRAQRIEAGGPATVGAAVAARLAGGSGGSGGARGSVRAERAGARLLAPFGTAPVRPLAAAWLRAAGVDWVDPVARRPHPSPVSSVLLDAATGARAVVSGGAPPPPDPHLPESRPQLPGPRSGRPAARGRSGTSATPVHVAVMRRHTLDRLLAGVRCVLVDGHALPWALAVAREARVRGIPVVLDGGSSKPGTAELLALVDLAIVSADFHAPGGGDPLDWVAAHGVRYAARTAGAAPVELRIGERRRSVAVPHVRVVDTLGAGDVLHGAAAHAVARLGLTDSAVPAILAYAVRLASASCRHPGPLGWSGDRRTLAWALDPRRFGPLDDRLSIRSRT